MQCQGNFERKRKLLVMANDPTPDLEVECNVVSEYGQAMASAAIRLLRYKDRMQLARSDAEREFIRREHAEFVRGVVRAHKIAFAAMIQKPPRRGTFLRDCLYAAAIAVFVVMCGLYWLGVKLK